MIIKKIMIHESCIKLTNEGGKLISGDATFTINHSCYMGLIYSGIGTGIDR